MIQRCLFVLFSGQNCLGIEKGYMDLTIQLGVFKTSLLKRVAVGIPRCCDVLKYKNKPMLLVDVDAQLAFSKGESMIPDPDLVDVLKVVCEDKLWRYMGSTNIEVWQMLALMGAGAGVLGAVLLLLQMFT